MRKRSNGDDTRRLGEGDTWEVVALSIIINSTNSEDENLEVHWDGPDDPADPSNFPLVLRWSMVTIISLCSLCALVTTDPDYPVL